MSYLKFEESTIPMKWKRREELENNIIKYYDVVFTSDYSEIPIHLKCKEITINYERGSLLATSYCGKQRSVFEWNFYDEHKPKYNNWFSYFDTSQFEKEKRATIRRRKDKTYKRRKTKRPNSRVRFDDFPIKYMQYKHYENEYICIGNVVILKNNFNLPVGRKFDEFLLDYETGNVYFKNNSGNGNIKRFIKRCKRSFGFVFYDTKSRRKISIKSKYKLN